MSCNQCKGIEGVFNEGNVNRELWLYRKKGADKTTRWLIEAIQQQGIRGLSLLDIGGGVGAIQHALLESGVERATDVDASQAYLNAAREEASRRGLAERESFQHGNFVDIAAQVSPADIVTLDRVICCYPDMERLVQLSAERAQKLYGVVYPRDRWGVKLVLAVMNFFFRIRRNPFRIFAHPSQAVEALAEKSGLKRIFYRQTLIWQVVVYQRG